MYKQVLNKMGNEYILKQLQERAKELNCLYTIEEILGQYQLDLDTFFLRIVEALPPGWQYPDFCHARIRFEDKQFTTADFVETQWVQKAEIKLQDQVSGFIEIFYTEEMPIADEGPFLKEERRLINTIAERTGHNIIHRRLKTVFKEWQETDNITEKRSELKLVLEMLQRTDRHMYSIISRKMINNLFCKGFEEAREFFHQIGSHFDERDSSLTQINTPSKKEVLQTSFELGVKVFTIAKKYLSDEAILNLIQKWIHEEKSFFLVKALINLNTPLTEVADAIRRYYHINPEADEKSSPISHGIKVSLIRRFLTDQLEYINIAKRYCQIKDFYDILQRMIFPSESHGKLGGKSAGLFLAEKIVQKSKENTDLLESVKTPKTWYITSDGVINFIYYNNLEEIIEQKYKNIEDVRKEYPHNIQAFKNSHFPSELVNGLSRALDDFGEHPIIVRSSSLLEDRMGSAFAGKYKSLFLANQGSKETRLESLMDAIAEVYASTFGPDPIGYRIERGLLDFDEEMGIMIQEVVGKKIGKYFFPAFAGVAFSHNEFRWSPRIRRDDGLIRMVTGLGTRAVDRIGNDYPVLLAPGQPELRVNLSVDDILNYSQKFIDVINLENNSFETISILKIKEEIGNSYPMINEIFSIHEEQSLRVPIGLGIETSKHDIAVTFENLIKNTNYIKIIDNILIILRENLKTPVDIEFACDGESLYLLQCRPQSSTSDSAPAVIPEDISTDKMLFSSNKNVSNGKVPDINYIVYVDPDEYSSQSSFQKLKDIGHIVGKLNKMLPKRSFILMGPGRWGSRDDIRLGVSVTYSDINNTAMLIEIARRKGNYMPDLSFGTHFFQDLVEASIRYLPLYPDDEGVFFKEQFFTKSDNILTRFLPEFAYLEDTVKVINIRENTGGMILRILMNADEDRAVGIFADPAKKILYTEKDYIVTESYSNEPLQWRLRMADSVALELDPERFCVNGVYLFGTVFDETAGPNSDIDILVHFNGNKEQKDALIKWFEGWNLCLSHINYNKSGYSIKNFLDVIYITDDDLREQQYYAHLIDPKNNNSRLLKLSNERNGFKKQ